MGRREKWNQHNEQYNLLQPTCRIIEGFITIDAQRAVPLTSHEYRITALQRLAEAFGFMERTRTIGPNGQLVYLIL